MGRSTASCFKIITCGSDSVDGRDDSVEAPGSKGSSDKRGWSFRKRSARHRVLSNTVIAESPPSLNKESPETATANLQTRPNATLQEKFSETPWTDEIPQLSTSVTPKVPDTKVAAEDDILHDVSIDEDEKLQDVSIDESVIVVIQAAIRQNLAQREVRKLKSVVKLQAAVRGHLVRRHAVGTLRCVQAIIKMQALVRARRVRIFSEGSRTDGMLDGGLVKDKLSSKFMEKGTSVTKPTVTYTSIEKLLSNKFAHQLLESTPRTKRIHIKCDPSKFDSAWIWLERWMSLSSTGIQQPPKPESRMEQQEQEKLDCSAFQGETGFPSEDRESANVKADTMETALLSESEEDLVTDDADNFHFQACQQSSSSKTNNLEPPQPENSGVSNSKESSLELLPDYSRQSDSISQMQLEPVSSTPEVETEQSTSSVKVFAPQQVETEGKKFVFGTRKATNPAFVAVQSKFEELSSTANSAKSTSSHNKDVGVESNSDSVSSAFDNSFRTREIGLAEDPVLHNSRVKVGGSECGTELSISSTLDSPAESENGAMDVDHETEFIEVGTSKPNSSMNLDTEAGDETTIIGSDLSYSILVQPKKLDDGANGELENSVTPVDSLQQKQKSETNGSNLQNEVDSETGHTAYEGANGEPVNSTITVDSSQEKQKSETNTSNLPVEVGLEPGHHMDKSSPEASPRSHITAPEFQGTPSSQVSVKAEKSRSGKGKNSRKRRSLSGGKQSPSNPNHDSGLRGSLEQLPKDQNTGKRRNSIGYDVDQEPRDSNSSNPLPSYMQATESARAKALANSSPRSSPDVQDKDIYIKKRHSLPGANGRQGSPRVQRSASRSQQGGAKGNGHPPERKWQR